MKKYNWIPDDYPQEEEFFERPPIQLVSNTLSCAIYSLDDKCFQMENEIVFLKKEVKYWQDEHSKLVNEGFKRTDNMMANTLLAIIGRPPIESIGPVGATIIAKIRGMKTIEQVQEYIQTLAEQAQTELA